jgi:dephospho-CoA kinase
MVFSRANSGGLDMIIAINGKAGSGKDIAADFVAADFKLIKVSFAGKIKEILEDVFGFDHDKLWGPSELRAEPQKMINGKNITSRDALQTVGEAFCEVYDNVWVDYVFKHSGNYIVISDQRKRNEFDIIKQQGGILIRIKRKGAGLKGKNGKHRSEKEMDSIKDKEYDIVINNDGTLEELREKLKIEINKRILPYIS